MGYGEYAEWRHRMLEKLPVDERPQATPGRRDVLLTASPYQLFGLYTVSSQAVDDEHRVSITH